VLGRFPLPVEVIPMARGPGGAALRGAYGGRAVVRAGVVTDNGNLILDVRGLSDHRPAGDGAEVNQWPGVVAVGIFARHRARVCLLGTPRVCSAVID
jgi:ribose 5-phosphate isomerase A